MIATDVLRQSDLERLSRDAEEIGVAMDMEAREDGSVWLAHLERGSGHPGSGRRALDMLCEAADEAECRIALAVEETCSPVVSIYEEAGFERMDDPSRAEDGFALMVREPNQ